MQSVVEAGRRMLDAVLPPTCAKCRVVVARNGTLCADCWKELRFLAPPWCQSCGFPFEYEGAEAGVLPAGSHASSLSQGPVCGECLQEPKAFDRARAALAYDDASRGLILAFKHADRTETLLNLVGWMALAGAELLEGADIIVPVPLHWMRLFTRRYNQSALLAQKLAERSHKPFNARVLERRRATAPQGHLSRAARQRNVAGAFRVRESARSAIEGRRVLLIDDVYTSGATIAACVRSLRGSGAAAVDVLTLARVLPD